jgi:LytS/YehU family sensor histidine kinase
LLLLFLLSMVLATFTGLGTYFGMAVALKIPSTDEFPIAAKLCLLFALRINLFLHCLNAIKHFLNTSKQKELEAEALRATTAKAQLDAVRSQVNPHFLFNNLNVLSSLVMTQNKDANSFLESFSTVYRYVLKSQDKDIVKLSEEMEFMEPYLFLLQKRFGDGLNVQIDIPASSLHLKIVPMAMQMLLENAIKHNIVSVHQPLQVSICVRNGQLVVSNRLQLKAADNSSGTGLKNISERYRLSTGKIITVEKTDDTFTVKLPLQG